MSARPLILDSRLIRVICPLKQRSRHLSSAFSQTSESQPWSYPPATVNIDNDQVARLASKPLHPLALADLVSQPHCGNTKRLDGESTSIGVIDTALRPAEIIKNCESFVSEICELKYGVRPSVVINGEPDTRLAHVPMHLEYIITELLKNAFRATVESGKEREPIEVTIAAAPDSPPSSLEEVPLDPPIAVTQTIGQAPNPPTIPVSSIPGVTIRIRDRGGGISPPNLPNIWAYSFTTFGEDEAQDLSNGNADALNAISGAGGADSSSLAGLGYGLPLGRAYAEHFGGGIKVQSLWGWGTDVYLKLRGLGRI
ncbi:hypothetical protein P7C71_g5790, partial [Lecanoromycetidae sp. Uapishka_2]